MNNQTIMLIGASGQVGSALFNQLRKAEIGYIHAYDRKGIDLMKSNEIRKEIERCNPDVIIYAAAYTDVERSESEATYESYAINVAAIRTIAKSAKKIGAGVVYYSSDYVFNGKKGRPYRTDDETSPLNNYGRTKLCGEHALLFNNPRSIVIRTSWVFSPIRNNFVKTMLRLAEEKKGEITIVNDQFGTPTSSFEIARKTIDMLKFCQSNYKNKFEKYHGVYHVTCAGDTNWFEYANYIIKKAKELGFPVNIEDTVPVSSEEFPQKAKRPKYSVLSNGRFSAAFGTKPRPWQECVDEVLIKIRDSQ